MATSASASAEAPKSKEETSVAKAASVKSSSFDPTDPSRVVTSAALNDDEGVEVVLGEQGPDQVVDQDSPSRPAPDQNVFRGNHPSGTRNGRTAYAPCGPPPPPPYGVQGSGSFGFGRQDYPAIRPPYPVPPYNPSGSFDDGSYHHRLPSHYSPHGQYPPPVVRYAVEDVNVISPNHKSGDPKYRSGTSGQRRSAAPHYYHYPPASPVSRIGQTTSPPRLRNFAVRRSVEGPYSKAQRSGDGHAEDGTWNPYPAPSTTASKAERSQPPLVTESSFDSDHFSNSHYSTHPSHPPTPGSGAPIHDPAQQFYGQAGSWASFDSAGAHPPVAPYDDYSRHPPHHLPRTRNHYPEPPYSPYSPHNHHSSGYHSRHSHYSPDSGFYPAPEHYGSYHGYGPPPQSYEDDERGLLKDYHTDRDSEDTKAVDGKKGQGACSKTATGIVLPAAAQEINFDVTDPPAEPVCPPSSEPLVESLADVNTYDVLCGRGGGTNSQIGNKRFRRLVQEFQPTYLLARRKEKPLLARTIVLIIRKRGGRFLRKDEETGTLYEVGDAKAEAKTSQALREGLDVRATKSATQDKKKKKKKGRAFSPASAQVDEEPKERQKPEVEKPDVQSPERTPERATPLKKAPSPEKLEPELPPSLPKLADEEVKAGMVHPHSPEAMQFRKRRRMRALACGADKFFPDFCPPRADLARSASPVEDSSGVDGKMKAESILQHSPMRRASSIDEEEAPKTAAPGCTAAALEIVTGAVTGGFCFGQTK